MRIILILVFVNLVLSCKADLGCYNSTNAIELETDQFKVFHYHDFSDRRESELKNIHYYGSDAILTDSLNQYSFISVVDRKTGDTLFKNPCPAFKNVLVSQNNKYIIGLSNIRFRNPYQLIVYDLEGNIILKKKIEYGELKLTDIQFRNFIDSFPSIFNEMVKTNRISFKDDYWYIPWHIYGFQKDSLFNDYSKRREWVSNHNFRVSISTMNYVHWYNEKVPEVKIIEEGGSVSEIKILNEIGNEQFLGVEGEFRTLYFSDVSFNMDYFVLNGYIDSSTLSEVKPLPLYNNPEPNKPIPMFVQIGDIYEHYSKFEDFLNQDSMRVVYDMRLCDSAKVFSFTMVVGNDSNYFAFENTGPLIPEEQKEQIIAVNNVKLVYFEDLRCDCYQSGERKRRKMDALIFYIIQ